MFAEIIIRDSNFPGVVTVVLINQALKADVIESDDANAPTMKVFDVWNGTHRDPGLIAGESADLTAIDQVGVDRCGCLICRVDSNRTLDDCDRRFASFSVDVELGSDRRYVAVINVDTEWPLRVLGNIEECFAPDEPQSAEIV